MLLTKQHNKRLSISVAMILVIVTAIVIMLSHSSPINAQDSDNSMASLLRRLNQEIVIDAGSEIFIHFVYPIEGIATELEIPFDTLENGKPRVEVIEIGTDYFCYRDNTGQVFFITCVPFSNIASISYTQLPS